MSEIPIWTHQRQFGLTLGRETIIKAILDHDQHFTYIEEHEMQDMINNGIPEGFERRVKLANESEGITELHVLNVIISKLQLLAGRLHRRAKDRDQKAIMMADSRIKTCTRNWRTHRTWKADRT